MLSIKMILTTALLSIQTYWDLRFKEIPLWVSLLGAAIGTGLSLWEGRSVLDILIALIPGIICLVLAKISREAIGYGDGILLLSLGSMCSISKLLSTCFWGTAFAGIVAMVLLIVFHKKGCYQIPFVPFLLLGWLMETIFSGGI